MNDLTQTKKMTVKEVANILNVSTELVKKRIRELFPNKMENGKTTYLNQKEVTTIKLRIQENSSLSTYNDCNRLSNMPKTNLEKQLLIQQAMILQQEIITELSTENVELKIENTKLKKQLTAPPKTMRAEINQLVRRKATDDNLYYGSVWLILYNEFYYRHSINLQTRAKNNKMDILDYCENNNLLHKLYLLAKEIF